MNAAPFDFVLVRSSAGERVLTADEFFRLPLSERIRHVIERSATFLKNGREVDRHEALARMRAMKAAPSPA